MLIKKGELMVPGGKTKIKFGGPGPLDPAVHEAELFHIRLSHFNNLTIDGARYPRGLGVNSLSPSGPRGAGLISYSLFYEFTTFNLWRIIYAFYLFSLAPCSFPTRPFVNLSSPQSAHGSFCDRSRVGFRAWGNQAGHWGESCRPNSQVLHFFSILNCGEILIESQMRTTQVNLLIS
jgi:hypothetical protein